MKRIFAFIFIIFLLAIHVNAENITDQMLFSIDDELSSFEDSLPNEVKNALPRELFDNGFSISGAASLTQEDFMDIIINLLLMNLPSILKSFSCILALIIVSSILNLMRDGFDNLSLNKAFELCSTLCISIFVFTLVSNIVNSTVDFISTLCAVMSTLTPLMSGIYIMSGSISTAAVSSSGTMLFITLLQNFVVIAIVPIIKASMCFSIIKSINTGIDISGFSKILKNTFTTVLIFTMTIFSFVMSYQSVLAQGNDSLSLRTAKFAAGSFIPIVGSSVSEALKTVSSSLSVIKGSVGVIGIIVIAIITLPSLISLFLNKLSFDICSGISKSLNCSNEASITEEASSICSFLLSIVSITCILFIFVVTIFLKSSV